MMLPGIAGQHAAERRHGSVNGAEVRDFRRSFKFFGRHIRHPPENGGHRVVDPDVDRTQLLFDPRRRSFDLVGIGHISGKREAFSAQLRHFPRGIVKALGIARDEAHGAPSRAKARAVARPTPAEAPVTTTILPGLGFRMILLIRFHLIVAAFPGIRVFPEECEFDARIKGFSRNIKVFAADTCHL